jgi:hypothetical protein
MVKRNNMMIDHVRQGRGIHQGWPPVHALRRKDTAKTAEQLARRPRQQVAC